jgi:DNA primase
MINGLDLKAIKREVKLESLLRDYHVELRPSGKDQYRGRCPIHRGDGRDAFHVNLARNIFHCFACHVGGTVLDFIAAMEGCSLFEAARRLKAMACTSIAEGSSTNEKELVTKRRKVSSPLPFTLTPIDSVHPYLTERGINKQTAIDFGVGFYAGPGLMRGRLVIPIHNADGELIAYCGRSVDQTQPRYRVPPGFAKSEVLFNMHRAAATEETFVVIVEGFFDCMKVHQAGIRSVVALMGVVSRNPRKFCHPKSSPATMASRSMIFPLL